MIEALLDKIEWVLLIAFLLASFDVRRIALLMFVNLASSIALYDWMVTAPPLAAAIVVTLINTITAMAILWLGEKSVQKVIQPIILIGFIGTDLLLLTGQVYDHYELILLALYGGMFLTITWSAGRGARNCIRAISGSYPDRHTDNDSVVYRDNKNI